MEVESTGPAETESGVDAGDEEPLELGADQIVNDVAEDTDDFVVPEMVVPDDIAFDDSETVRAQGDVSSTAAKVESQMPDPTLSDELADQLIEPATEAAARHAFSRIGELGLGTPGMTLENVVRELLRPMLKDWLDENLPSVVEAMVEREIERLSRGKH